MLLSDEHNAPLRSVRFRSVLYTFTVHHGSELRVLFCVIPTTDLPNLKWHHDTYLTYRLLLPYYSINHWECPYTKCNNMHNEYGTLLMCCTQWEPVFCIPRAAFLTTNFKLLVPSPNTMLCGCMWVSGLSRLWNTSYYWDISTDQHINCRAIWPKK